MFSDQPFFAYTFLHAEFYESLDHYQPGPELRDYARGLVPDDWRLAPSGFWTHCSPPEFPVLYQGWKIHLSAAPATALETLDRVVPVLVRRGLAFKFVSDSMMLRTSLSKNWSRSGAGKFVTVYPPTTESFIDCIEELYQATAELRGPFVLSDRPYRDSRVVFYRYGEHVPRPQVDVWGFQRPVLEAPDGSWHPDVRTGTFVLPPWIEDPLSNRAPLKPPGEDGILLHDRYQVLSALRFNATGGIYGGVDTTTGRAVVIREARPLLGTMDDDSDSFALLHREAAILRRLGPTGVLPQFVEMFQEWEHLFLVQERIAAESLWGYAINFYFSEPDLSPAVSFSRFRDTALKLLAALRVVHEHGVVLRDLTRNNTLMTENDEVRFIDLEFAHEADSGNTFEWVQTPGYASPSQLRFQQPTYADDWYSMGVLLLDILTFNAAGLDLNRAGILAALDLTLADLRLPAELSQLIRGLTAADGEQRWDLERAEEFLRAIPVPADQTPLFQHLGHVPEGRGPARDLTAELEETLQGTARFIHAMTRTERRDTLWPSSAEIFLTGPVSLQYGATGVAFFLLRLQGRVPEEVLDWIAAHASPQTCAPGLGRGLAGVALLFLECGRAEAARKMLDVAAGSPLLEEANGLYCGVAGLGLVQLHAWSHLGDQSYLDRALDFGEHLERTAFEVPAGVTWSDPERSFHGLFDGPSGVALFLVHLAAATGERRFLDLARRGLDFDLAHRQEFGAHLIWYPQVNAGVSDPKSPHLWFATAGIGPVLLRAWALCGDPELLGWVERCAASVSERYTNKIWHDFGLAGFGELLLDCYLYLGDQKYLDAALYIAEAVLPQRVDREEGYAWLGMDHHRICCDLGSGAAGIGLFLQRALNPEQPRMLMLDRLLLASRDAFAAAAPLATPA